MTRSCLFHLATRTTSHAARVGRNVSALSASGSATDDGYVSPYQDFFDMIDRNETSFNAMAIDAARRPSPVMKCGVLEDNLEFSTTCYGRLALAPHVMPQEHRVVMKVHLEDLPISTQLEKVILREIVGKRMSEEKNILQIQSNIFGSRIENKRHLVSMLDRIIIGTKSLAKEMEKQEEEMEKES